MSDHQPAVSARGVLDGDPAALAGLCDLRGPSVIAYCEAVCGPDESVAAAAAAFAAFRSTAVRATRPLALNPDAVLIAGARTAAADRAPDPSGGVPRRDDPLCPEVPHLLAGAAGDALTPADRHRLRRHLARCIACRAAQNAQREAERAYLNPPVGELGPIARQTIIAALRHAAPVSEAAPANSRPRSVASLAPITAEARLDGRAAVPASPAAAGPGPPPDAVPPPAPPAGRARVIPPISPPPPRPARPARQPHPTDPPTPPGEVATGVIAVDQIAAALGYAGPGDGPPSPGPAARPARAATRGRLLGVRILAPAAVLLVAVLVVLAIAGVFGSAHPSSPASGSAVPAGFGGTATAPAPTDPTATHLARVRAANLRRAARARKRAAGASGAGASPGPSTARVLAAPAEAVPPAGGAAPAASGGYHAD